jgi:YVTN family beta-propeller protein
VTKLATGSVEPEPPPMPAHDCAPTALGAITVGNTPRGITLDSARQRVYVANFGGDSVSVIDSSTNTVIETISGVTSANGIAYDETHNLVWVTNYNSDQVTPIEVNEQATSFSLLPAVEVGDGPWGAAYDPVHGYLYVANSLDNSVSVIDGASRTVVATVSDSFDQPFHLAANPVTGKVYVANFGNHTVTVLEGSSVNSVVNLWDSVQPYGIAVDESRDLVYVATVGANRIVAIGWLNGVPDQFLGWAAFYRGFGDRNRPLPLRAIAIHPSIGPSFDGGHLWATTSTADGSELNQALFIPKGWNGYFHVPLAQNVADNPAEGVAVDRTTNRVYVSSGATSGTVTVIGDHANQCPVVSPATLPDGANDFEVERFSREVLASGDATGDGLIDIFDLSFIAARYNSTDYTADVNGDGLVDIFDLTIVASRYGQSP